jgi:hypothetical protein
MAPVVDEALGRNSGSSDQMSIPSLNALLMEFQRRGAQRVLCKRLAENDNSKQQVYLGNSFEALNILPFGAVTTDATAKVPTMKAPLQFWWLNDEGQVAVAAGAQLILYPSYPEVRLSGFIRGCQTAPSELMRPVPAEQRRFNNGPDGRLMFLALSADRSVIAYLVEPGSEVAGEFEYRDRRMPFAAVGVFLDVTLPSVGNPRELVLARLREIHAAGWHASCRLHSDGTRHPYAALNGGGYTLEALFDVIPNAKAEPDFHGWELKACGSDRVTLMTPEPDSGYYGEKGVEAFIRRHGHVAKAADTLYFTGLHRAGFVCATTGLQLVVRGFDAVSERIVDVEGGIYLVTAGGEDSAGWTFARLLEHWCRKHAFAVYVSSEKRVIVTPEYRYLSPVLLGEGTSFGKFLKMMDSGLVFYDPGSKVASASSAKPKVQARSQFRVSKKNIWPLYNKITTEPID